MSAVLRRALMLCVTSTMLFASLAASADAATKPTAPTGVTVTAGPSTATVSWKAAARATHYRVCLLTAKTQTKCGTVSGQLTKTTHTLTGLKEQAGTDYYVRVYAYNSAGRTGSALKGFNLKPLVKPGVTSGIKQTVTQSTIAVTWKAASHTTAYSICLVAGTTSTRCVQSAPKSTALSAKFTGLKPTNGADYFYRVRAYNGSASSFSAQQRADLPVAAVTGATAVNGGSGAFEVSWDAATNAGTYELQVSTSSTFKSNVKTFTVSQTSATPKLTIAATWFYRVRGLNGVRASAYTPVQHLRLPSGSAKVYVMTYNLCGQDKCVTKANKMKKWSTRKTYAGKLVRASDADIIATQESHDKDTKFGNQLPGFGLASYYSAKSLFYDKAKYSVLRSGTITLNKTEKKYAVWAEFRQKATRNTFIVADAHLQPSKGKAKDDLRSAQTKVLLSRIKAINTQSLPVIYAGDFNSNKSNADQSRYPGGYDAPLKVFTAAGIPDAFNEASQPVHGDFNSANQAINPPLRHTDHVDHIYVDPGIKVTAWRVLVDLTSAKQYVTPFPTDHNPVRAVLSVPGR